MADMQVLSAQEFGRWGQPVPAQDFGRGFPQMTPQEFGRGFPDAPQAFGRTWPSIDQGWRSPRLPSPPTTAHPLVH